MHNDNSSLTAGLSRRSLFTATASAGALAALGATAGGALADHGGPPYRVPGIQLYTVRDSMAEDPLATLTAIAAMGYGAVEFAGYHGIDLAELRGWLDELGLRAPCAHVDPNAMRDDPELLIEQAVIMGHDILVLPWLGEEHRSSAASYRGWAEVLNRAGQAGQAHGVRAAYHNHAFEFETVDGIVPLELLVAETDPALVDFELDFFWAIKAGHKVGEVLAWAPERFTMAHIKDMSADGAMVDVGTGVIDFRGLLSSEVARYIRHPFVEHDNPVDPFRCAAIGRYHLSRALG